MHASQDTGIRGLPREVRLRPCPGAGVALLAALLLFGLTGPSQAAREDITDADITNAVTSEFWTDDVVDSNSIDVTTQEGIVTLNGQVDNILERERATALAESIVGVRAVVNRMEVKPVSRSDAALHAAVQGALLEDPATESYEVSVSVREGSVTLEGTVDSWQEKQLCATVAKGVRGVRSVTNDIRVQYKVDRPDSEIQREVKARLENDVLVDDYLIEVRVSDGEVSLSGTVGSLAEKNRARSDGWVSGVTTVNAGNLDIEWWARDEMRRRNLNVARSDAEIREAVQDAFLYDPRVLSFKPGVDVDNGTVTLTGVVDNLAAKKAAEEDASNVIGVRRVRNHLKVRPEVPPPHEELEENVARALRRDPVVEREDLDIVAASGTVYLSGTVNTSYEKERAERVARTVWGVTNVFNALDHEYTWTWKRDQEIREDVKEELFWSPFVDEEELTVAVEDGVVTLTGEVDTWSESFSAEENAFEGGAKDVRNRLTVTYPYYGPNYGGYYLGY